MDLVTTTLAKAGANASGDLLKKESESFLKVVLGEPAKSLGGLFSDQINARRHANLIKITVAAKRRLDDGGISANEVPLKIIHPLLEGACLEESPDLQDMWAALLAGAATKGEDAFYAGFIHVLKQISPEEARFLKALRKRINNNIGIFEALPEEEKKTAPRPDMRRIGLAADLYILFCDANGITECDEDACIFASICFENLARLGIIGTPSFGRAAYSMCPYGAVFLECCCDDVDKTS